MNASFKNIVRDKSIRYSMLLTGVFCMLQVIGMGVFFFRIPPVVPLFNSFPWGNDRLAPVQVFFMVPIVLFLCAIINALFAATEHKRFALISRMLSLNILLVSVLSAIAVAQILLLIF